MIISNILHFFEDCVLLFCIFHRMLLFPQPETKETQHTCYEIMNTIAKLLKMHETTREIYQQHEKSE